MRFLLILFLCLFASATTRASNSNSSNLYSQTVQNASSIETFNIESSPTSSNSNSTIKDDLKAPIKTELRYTTQRIKFLNDASGGGLLLQTYDPTDMLFSLFHTAIQYAARTRINSLVGSQMGKICKREEEQQQEEEEEAREFYRELSRLGDLNYMRQMIRKINPGFDGSNFEILFSRESLNDGLKKCNIEEAVLEETLYLRYEGFEKFIQYTPGTAEEEGENRLKGFISGIKTKYQLKSLTYSTTVELNANTEEIIYKVRFEDLKLKGDCIQKLIKDSEQDVIINVNDLFSVY